MTWDIVILSTAKKCYSVHVSTLHDNYTHIYNNPSSRETVQDIKKQSKTT